MDACRAALVARVPAGSDFRHHCAPRGTDRDGVICARTISAPSLRCEGRNVHESKLLGTCQPAGRIGEGCLTSCGAGLDCQAASWPGIHSPGPSSCGPREVELCSSTARAAVETRRSATLAPSNDCGNDLHCSDYAAAPAWRRFRPARSARRASSAAVIQRARQYSARTQGTKSCQKRPAEGESCSSFFQFPCTKGQCVPGRLRAGGARARQDMPDAPPSAPGVRPEQGKCAMGGRGPCALCPGLRRTARPCGAADVVCAPRSECVSAHASRLTFCVRSS